MNTLEIKGSLFDLLWSIEDKETLLKIRAAAFELINQKREEKKDWWDELSVEQQARLRKAIEETERGENLIPHEQVMKEIEEKFKTIST
ncbi:MAG TPA: hypothetical protein ENJ95_17450 [Bacteroidetes bacterium]|nr:hypothetical protein [Bacteroidota bacterium]